MVGWTVNGGVDSSKEEEGSSWNRGKRQQYSWRGGQYIVEWTIHGEGGQFMVGIDSSWYGAQFVMEVDSSWWGWAVQGGGES